MNYKELKEKILKDLNFSNPSLDKEFKELQEKICNGQSFVVTGDKKEGAVYTFDFVKEYRSPIEPDSYNWIYHLRSSQFPSKPALTIAWYGSYSSYDGVQLFTDFGGFEFVEDEVFRYHKDLKDKENTVSWFIDNKPETTKSKAYDLDLERVAKILKQYDIPYGNKDSLWQSIVQLVAGDKRANIGKTLSEKDFVFDTVKISKKKDSCIIEFTLFYNSYIMTLKEDKTANGWKAELLQQVPF